MKADPREKLSQRHKTKSGLTQQDKVRLVGLVVLLILVVVVYVYLTNLAQSKRDQESGQGETPIRSVTSLPPLDQEALATVRDAEASDRVILEPEAFQSLAAVAQLLLPGHLRAHGEPALPYDEVMADPPALRGKPFRIRGELVDARPTVRTPGAPEEFWTWIRTDGGKDVLFVALRPLKELFSENFVKADGLFLKIYTYTWPDGTTVTAPLLLGREIIASFLPLAPTKEIDHGILAKIVDPRITEDEPLHEEGKWHLLNVARTVADDPDALQRHFAEATLVTREVIKDMAADPAAYRGKPFVLECRVVNVKASQLGENPLRMEFITSAFGGNNNWGTIPFQALAPERYPFPATGDPANSRVLLGWFLQLWAYEDGDGARRRAPVFVIAGENDVGESGPGAFFSQMIFGFMGLALVLIAVMVFLGRKDKRESLAAAKTLDGMRKRLREQRQS